MATTQFELVTPNRTLYSGEAEMVVCRSVSGEIAFLANHMPYIGALDPGVVRIVGPVAEGSETAGAEIAIAVRGGFVEVRDNQVIMLADEAELGSEIDLGAAEREAQHAEGAVPGGEEDETSEADADTALRWAQVRVETAQLSAGTRAH